MYAKPLAADNVIDLDWKPSKHNTSVSLLLHFVTPVSPATLMQEVYDRFTRHPSVLVIPVVEDGKPVGLINRNTLIELFSKPFARDLNARALVQSIMDTKPIIVDQREAIDDLARIIIDAGMQYMYDGFIITHKGQYVGMGTGHDLLNEITERKQQHLYHLAHYDQLTGLPNRLLFKEQLAHAVSQAKRNSSMLALLFIDIDRFKFINDTYGHPTGDFVLQKVAQRMTQCLRKSDTLARLSGDEFTLILENINSLSGVTNIAQNLLASISKVMKVDKAEIFVSASIGVVIYPFDDDELDGGYEELLKKADAAMYSAKKQGRNSFQYYSSDIHDSALARMQIENNLRYALRRNEMQLHYQPQVDLETGRIVGVEALLRWTHPEMGVVPPDTFIPIAEEMGLIIDIGEYVLRSACCFAKRLHDEGHTTINMAVNLSARQMQSSLPDLVDSILEETGLDPSRLELELTENSLVENVEECISILQQLSDQGVQTSIDDFGTGYSSLSYLQRLPIGTLKIDRSFLNDVQDRNDDAPIITTIIGMAHNMKLKVIAEGVETREQLEFLRLHGCEWGQGYFFSKPVSADELTDVLQQGLNIQSANVSGI